MTERALESGRAVRREKAAPAARQIRRPQDDGRRIVDERRSAQRRPMTRGAADDATGKVPATARSTRTAAPRPIPRRISELASTDALQRRRLRESG